MSKVKLAKLAKSVNYGEEYHSYVPSKEAIQYSHLNKMIYDGEFENVTPIAHYQMFDTLHNNRNTCIVAARGIAKSTFVQNLFFYVAIYGSIPSISKVNFMLYISDTVDNGCKTMTKNMEYTYNSSPFLQKYLPNCKFSEGRWVLTNIDGNSLIVRTYGAESGIRGAREQNQRPQIAIVDDVLNDSNAESPTKLKSIRNTIFKAIKFALHPKDKKFLLIGTPFHDNCIVSQAVASGNFDNLILPICEKFPCSKDEFRGVWEDRFPYSVISELYNEAERNSELLASEIEDEVDDSDGLMTLEGFYQELMLQVNSSTLKVVDGLRLYSKEDIMNNKEAYTFYITTDFATKDNESGDLSVIFVWAYDDNHNLFIIDGICGHNNMTTNISELFRLVVQYRPMSVGIETSGQQGGFVSWIKRDMIINDIHFIIKECPSSNNKLVRFNVILPKIQANKIFLVKEDKGNAYYEELLEELDGVTRKALTATYDDAIDCLSQIQFLDLYRPYYESIQGDNDNEIERVKHNSSMIYKMNRDNKRYKVTVVSPYIV